MRIRLITAGIVSFSMLLMIITAAYGGTAQGIRLEDKSAEQAHILYDEESDYARGLAFIPLFLFGAALFAAGGFGRKILAKKNEKISVS